jgi:uncharacterized integral membrane protein
MRYVGWFIKIVVFLLLFSFAVKNTTPVVLNGLAGASWTAPLVVFLMLFFAAGVLLGLAAMGVVVLRMRRELSNVRRELRSFTERSAPRSLDEVEPTVPLDAVG